MPTNNYVWFKQKYATGFSTVILCVIALRTQRKFLKSTIFYPFLDTDEVLTFAEFTQNCKACNSPYNTVHSFAKASHAKAQSLSKLD